MKITATKNLERIRQEAKKKVDNEAEKARLKLLTKGEGQMLVYENKAEEMLSFFSQSNPNPEDFPLLNAEVGITGNDVNEVAQVVQQVRTNWKNAAAQIEANRLSAKRNIEAADTPKKIWEEAVFNQVNSS